VDYATFARPHADRVMAETKKDAVAAFDAFVETWGVNYEKAVECLIENRDAQLAFYDFPGQALEESAHHERHRKFVRHGMPSHRGLQRMSLKQDRARPSSSPRLLKEFAKTSCRKSSSI
jgi:transposase-like protein